MTGTRYWVDAHSHLADPRWAGQEDAVIQRALTEGIHYFMQGGLGPDDWQRQKDLKARYPHNIGLCFGLHPYWVAAHDQAECENALDILATELPMAQGLGETGLDFRPHILKDSLDRQYQAFETQLELAHFAAKPVVLHLVQAHEEGLRVLDIWGLPSQGGFVHSFNGSAVKAQEFIEKGLFLSIGGPVCRPDNKKLHQAIQDLPLEYLLIESDSPDQPPPSYAGQLNPPQSIWDVARSIGQLKSLDPMEILDITTENFKRLFKISPLS